MKNKKVIKLEIFENHYWSPVSGSMITTPNVLVLFKDYM